jgi:hypothetical protein
MEINVGGDYLNADNCKTGDVVEFLDEGVKSVIKRANGEKEVYNFRVKCNSKEIIFTPSGKTLKQFVDAWGKESKNWVSKKFSVKIVAMEVQGKELNVIRANIL